MEKLVTRGLAHNTTQRKDGNYVQQWRKLTEYCQARHADSVMLLPKLKATGGVEVAWTSMRVMKEWAEETATGRFRATRGNRSKVSTSTGTMNNMYFSVKKIIEMANKIGKGLLDHGYNSIEPMKKDDFLAAFSVAKKHTLKYKQVKALAATSGGRQQHCPMSTHAPARIKQEDFIAPHPPGGLTGRRGRAMQE